MMSFDMCVISVLAIYCFRASFRQSEAGTRLEPQIMGNGVPFASYMAPLVEQVKAEGKRGTHITPSNSYLHRVNLNNANKTM